MAGDAYITQYGEAFEFWHLVLASDSYTN